MEIQALLGIRMKVMNALKLPKRYKITQQNKHLCARISVIFNGKDMWKRVCAYDIEKGTITLQISGETKQGKVEVYWR